MDTDTRRIYYKTTTELRLPENPQWRFWKFKLEDGTWKYIRGIKGATELRDLLVKLNPEAFYYSTSEFLTPERVEHANYQIAEQCFLESKYLVIDIDNVYGHEQVRNSAHEVMERMGPYKEIYPFERLVFTGRGCRLEFRDNTVKPMLLPDEKEEWIKKVRKEFCMINLSDIAGVDDIIAWDTRRVIKGFGSPNPHNDYTTTILASPAYIPAIPGKVNEVGEKTPSSSLQKQGSSTERELGYSPPFPVYFGRFIKNKVEGTKDRYVPYFVYYKKYEHWQEDLVFLQKFYGLSTIYVMDDYMKVMAMSVDAVPAPRLDKIYKKSKSLVKNTWKKFHQIYIRTSSFFTTDLKKIKEYDLHPLFKIDNSAHKMFPISQPHIDFLNHIGFHPPVEGQQIGNPKNKVIESYFEKRRFEE